MLDPKFFDNLAKQLSLLIPPNLNTLRQDLEQNFKTTLQTIFSKLDLVSREEFDVQAKLLQKAREKMTLLEEKLTQIEARNTDPTPE